MKNKKLIMTMLFQYKEPLKITRALKEIIFSNKTPRQVGRYLK